MHALIAFAIGPVGRWIAGIAFVGVLALSIYSKGYGDGGRALQAKIDAREAKATAGAKKEADRVQGGDRSNVKGFDRD
jgi:hypothetical protein